MEEHKLTGKKAKALEGLLDGLNVQDAATAAGVNRKTLGRWLQEPQFWKLYQLNSRRGLELAARRLTGNLDGAVELITSVMEDDEAPPAVRLRAAQHVIDSSLRLLDATDIQERLAALEERLAHV